MCIERAVVDGLGGGGGGVWWEILPTSLVVSCCVGPPPTSHQPGKKEVPSIHPSGGVSRRRGEGWQGGR